MKSSDKKLHNLGKGNLEKKISKGPWTQNHSQPAEEIAETFFDNYYAQIQEKLNSLDLEKDLYSEWHQGKVYKISIEISGKKKEFIILKHRIGDRKESTEATFKEFRFHKQTYFLLQQHPEIAQHIWIPKLYGCLEKSDGFSYIVMDFIPGLTLYAAKIQAVLPIIYDDLVQNIGREKVVEHLWHKESFIHITTDKEAKWAMDRIFSLPFVHDCLSKLEKFTAAWWDIPYDEYLEFWERIGIKNILQTKIQQDPFRLEELYAGTFDKLKHQYALTIKDKKRIESVQHSWQEFVTIMNKEKIYHNDFRSRNIILGDDDKLYMLDFGLADTQPIKKTEKINVGDQILINRIKSLQ